MDNWLRSRLHLTQRLQKQIEQRVGPGLGVPSLYRNEFERCFRGSWRVRRPHFLLTRCRKAQLLFLADFHALKQSQRGHLRLLKQLPAEEWGLALECVETQHQEYLDNYLAGKISEVDFLKKTEWRERWEFPWENYRIFFDWARENKVPVLALNLYLKESSQASLLHRDRHAAEVLSHALLARERPRWAVIFGEQHLAPQHLPLEVKRFHSQVASLVVFQNRDSIFFELLKKGRDVDSDVVELANGHFLVSNIPPWVKWQDYLLHLERTSDQSWSHASEVREDFLGGEGLELSDDISHLVRVLSQDLEVSEPSVHLEIYTSLDKKFWKWIQRKLKTHEKMWVQDWIESGLSFYLPHFQVGYLARFSLNHSSQIAMSVLHSEKAGWREISTSPSD
ncbi:MAG: ChaN family lipoprotein, partial [Bdellovibrio sp.]